MPPPPETLHLCFGEAFEDLLSHHQVFAEHRFAIAGGEVSLYVIGASSIVLVEAAGLRLAEMIACGPSRRGFGSFSEAGLSLRPGCGGQVGYQTDRCAYSGELSATELSKNVEAPRLARGNERVCFRFPSAGSPLTEIEASETEPGRLLVRTLHEYPEHQVRVQSRSVWELAPLAGACG